MWGIARYDLGLTDKQFWNLRPVEFDMLLERWILYEERLDRRASLVATILININKTKKGKTAKINDFMIHDFRGKRVEQNWQQQLNVLKALQSKITPGKKV